MPKLTYPSPRKGDVVEDYHGTKVADPYQWMEDLDAKETADWVAASNAVTEPYLAQLPLRQRFNERLTELRCGETHGCKGLAGAATPGTRVRRPFPRARNAEDTRRPTGRVGVSVQAR